MSPFKRQMGRGMDGIGRKIGLVDRAGMMNPIVIVLGIWSLSKKVKKRKKSNYAVLQICTLGQIKMTIDL